MDVAFLTSVPPEVEIARAWAPTVAVAVTACVSLVATVITLVVTGRRARADRSRQAAAEVIASSDSWWLPFRDSRRDDGDEPAVRVRPEEWVPTGRAVARIADREIRTIVRNGFDAVRALGDRDVAAVPYPRPREKQRQLMRDVGHVLQAHSRGDKPSRVQRDAITDAAQTLGVATAASSCWRRLRASRWMTSRAAGTTT